MSKRKADNELNQDNWDEDVTVIDSKNFEKAVKQEIDGRKILKPRFNRSIKAGTTGLFKGFTGLSTSSDSVSPSFSFSMNSSNVSSVAAGATSNMFTIPGIESSVKDSSKETEYLKKLQTLNQNFLEWITKHIKEDPHCIVTPIFADYEKHLKFLNEKYPEHAVSPDKKFNGLQSGKEDTNSLKLSQSEGDFPKRLPLSFMSVPVANPQSDLNSKPTFNFGFPSLSSSIPPNVPTKPQLSLAASFPSVSTVSPSLVPAADDDDDYVPPKPVVKEIKEPDSVFTTRCKLFYKVESEWRERGVGNLYIKPTGEEKFQLLIRADTNLGNILLNVLITRDIPIKLQKNNVTLVCVPSPPLSAAMQKQPSSADPVKPVPMLIRVKTEGEAKNLLTQFDKYRRVTET